MSERGRIIKTIFELGDTPFPASLITDDADVRPSAVYAVINLMDCVAKVGETQGEARLVNSYQVTGKPPLCCSCCRLNSIEANSCCRAPTYSDPSDSDQLTPWQIHQQMCLEANNGNLTDRDGKPIPLVGHWDGKKFEYTGGELFIQG